MTFRLRITLVIAAALTLCMTAGIILTLLEYQRVDYAWARSAASIDLYRDVAAAAKGKKSPRLLAVNDPRVPEAVHCAMAGGGKDCHDLGLASPTPTEITYISAKQPTRVWSATPLSGTYYVEFRGFLELEQRQQERLTWAIPIFFGGLTASLLLAIAIAWLLTRRMAKAVRIVRTMETDTSGSWQPIAERVKGNDEIAELARAVDTAATSLAAKRNTEIQFTANVAHDLRTPLTGLIAAADLLPAGTPTDMVRDRAEKLRTLVEDLLEVSRLDSGREEAHMEAVPLVSVVRGIVGRANSMAATREQHCQLHTGAPTVVRTDPRRLDRVMANLIANARANGRPPIIVTTKGAVITVDDYGPGYPEWLLVQGPKRFHTDSAYRNNGNGLGLTIAAGQADLIGATLTFTNTAHGARAIIDLSNNVEHCEEIEEQTADAEARAVALRRESIRTRLYSDSSRRSDSGGLFSTLVHSMVLTRPPREVATGKSKKEEGVSQGDDPGLVTPAADSAVPGGDHVSPLNEPEDVDVETTRKSPPKRQSQADKDKRAT